MSSSVTAEAAMLEIIDVNWSRFGHVCGVIPLLSYELLSPLHAVHIYRAT